MSNLIGKYLRCVYYRETVDEAGNGINDGIERSYIGRVLDTWTTAKNFWVLLVDDKGALRTWRIDTVNGEPDTFLVPDQPSEPPYR